MLLLNIILPFVKGLNIPKISMRDMERLNQALNSAGHQNKSGDIGMEGKRFVKVYNGLGKSHNNKDRKYNVKQLHTAFVNVL